MAALRRALGPEGFPPVVSSGAVDHAAEDLPPVLNAEAGLIAGWSLLAGSLFVLVTLACHWLQRAQFDWGRAIACGVVAMLLWEVGETIVKAARKGGGR